MAIPLSTASTVSAAVTSPTAAICGSPESQLRSSVTKLTPHHTVLPIIDVRAIIDFRREKAADLEYTNFVDDIGDGANGDDLHPVNLRMISEIDMIESAIEYLHPNYVLQDDNLCIRSCFLSPLNTLVDDFNIKILNRFPGEEDTAIRSPIYSLWNPCSHITV